MKSVAISVKLKKDKGTHSVVTEVHKPVCKNGVSHHRKRKRNSAFCETNLATEHPSTEHLDGNIEDILKLPAEHYEEKQICQMEFQNDSAEVSADLAKETGCSSTSFKVNKKKKVHEWIKMKDRNLTSNNKTIIDTNVETDHFSKNDNKAAKQTLHQCETCKKVFSERSNLITHKITHAAEKPYICDKCGKAYTMKGSLKLHKVIHTGEKPYACKVCGYSTARKSDLVKHELIHTGEKPYVCRVCGYACARPSNLKEHKRIHTGEKPYVCKVCGYASAQLSNLKRHELTHTGEKPYVCKVCGYASAQLSNMKKHERTHTGEKPYVCSVCERAFTTQFSLTRHERIHTR